MKRLIAVLLILLLSLLSGCRLTLGHSTFKHYGKYPEYFSIAINSLLGISGSERDQIEILERDSKGRVMFVFSSFVENIDTNPEDNIYRSEIYSIMICQKTDSKYAYFYPDYNFVAAHDKEEITEEEIAELKSRNDWDKDINEDKMTKVRIVRIKDLNNSGGLRKEKIFKDKHEVDFENETLTFTGLGKDKDNRWLYFVRAYSKKDGYKRSYLLILNEDYTYEDSYLQQIDDVWNYQDQLKKFKELNNWNLYVE